MDIVNEIFAKIEAIAKLVFAFIKDLIPAKDDETAE